MIGVREERIEIDPKAFVAYLNNVDVGYLCGELNHGIIPCLLCFLFIYFLLASSRVFASRSIRVCSRSSRFLCSKVIVCLCLVCHSLANIFPVLDLYFS